MTNKQHQIAMIHSLTELGFSPSEIDLLLRIERALHRWFELECGDGNDHGSWAIERGNEGDGPPFMVHHHYLHGRGKDYTTKTRIADREKGAKKKLAAIMAEHPDLVSYVQSDPRGCALYIVRRADIPEACQATGPATFESRLEQYYNRGVAVAA